MKTGNIKVRCPRCNKNELAKDGKRKSAKNQIPIQQYKCTSCKHRFNTNSLRTTKNQRRLDLNNKVYKLYCEGNTLRGISRLLGCHYDTVVCKFRFMANLAREAHLKRLKEGEIQTTYVQIDEMQTFEHTHERPLGIELAVRPKTYEIVSARVCRIPVNALSISPSQKESYNATSTRSQTQSDMCMEIDKVLKDKATIKGDGSIPTPVRDYFGDKDIQSVSSFDEKCKELWVLNHICAKLRHRMSRLNRKTWATTKRMERLQMHLDLLIACQNGYKLVG